MLAADVSLGQVPRAPGGSRAAYYSTQVAPPVSPYLNLLTRNPAGISNYQTLVRPMLEQRDALAAQAVQIRALEEQLGALRTAGPRRTATTGRRSFGTAPRFMNLSHYYGGLQR
jgi:hypothetical protein